MKRVISAILAISLLGLIAATPAMAAYTATIDPVSQYTYYSGDWRRWEYYDEAQGKWLIKDFHTSTQVQAEKAWLDETPTARAVLFPEGIKTEYDVYGDGSGQWFQNFPTNWDSRESLNISLMEGVGEYFTHSYPLGTANQDDETSQHAMKYAYNVLGEKNAIIIKQMGEWNGYLFVLTEHSEPIVNVDGLQVYSRCVYGGNKDYTYVADDPNNAGARVSYAVKGSDGVWYATDAKGDYYLKEDGKTKYLYKEYYDANRDSSYRNFTEANYQDPTKKLTKQVPILRVYDLEGFISGEKGTGKTYLKDWNVYEDLGVNIGEGGTVVNQYAGRWQTIGFEFNGDNMIIYSTMAGIIGDGSDGTRTVGMTVFNINADRDAQGLTLEKVTLNGADGEEIVNGTVNIYKGDGKQHDDTVAVNKQDEYNRFVSGSVGNKVVSLAAKNFVVGAQLSGLDLPKLVSITDLSDIENGNVSVVKKNIMEWLGYEPYGVITIEEAMEKLGTTDPNDAFVKNEYLHKSEGLRQAGVRLIDFKLEGTKAYAIFGLKHDDLTGSDGGYTTWYYDILAYDISDPENPVQLSQTGWTSRDAANAPGTGRLYIEGDYAYLVGRTYYNRPVEITDEFERKIYINVYKLNAQKGIESLLQTIELRDLMRNDRYFTATNGAYDIDGFQVLGNYLNLMINMVRENYTSEVLIELSPDKTEVVDSLYTAQRHSRIDLYDTTVQYGARTFVEFGNGPVMNNAQFHVMPRVTVLDMTDSGIVDMRVGEVPSTLPAGSEFTLTADVFGIGDISESEDNVFKIDVYGEDEPRYVTLGDLESGEMGSIVESTYSTKLAYTFDEDGYYEVTLTPYDSRGEEITTAAETFTFVIGDAERPAPPVVLPAAIETTVDVTTPGKIAVTNVLSNATAGVEGTPLVAIYNGTTLVGVRVLANKTVAADGTVTFDNAEFDGLAAGTYNVKAFFVDMQNVKPLVANSAATAAVTSAN